MILIFVVTLMRSTVEYILNKIHLRLSGKVKGLGGNPFTIPTEKKLLMTLWYLANLESFRQVADRFGVRKSTAHHIISSVINTFNDIKDDYIKWPSIENYNNIANKFESRKNFPCIVIKFIQYFHKNQYK